MIYFPAKMLGRCYDVSENHEVFRNMEEEPWKEFMEYAYWNDSLIHELEKIVEMDDEEFHRIELKVAYSQYIMLSHAAKNLAELKEKARLQNLQK